MVIVALTEEDPRLRLVCASVSRAELRLKAQQAEIDALLDYVHGRGNKKMADAPRDENSQSVVGLSANQVGLMKQVCVVDLSIGRRGYYDLHVLVNPRIVWKSKTTVERNEGCVNFTTIRGKTRRALTVRVEAIDRSGNEISLKLTGWPAILLQHEVDHLNGHLFIDRLVDPKHADLVEPGEYAAYRKQRGLDWLTKVDVSDRVVA